MQSAKSQNVSGIMDDCKMKHQQGITIFELIMVLVIVGIFSSFAIANYGSSEIDCDNPNAKQSPLVRAKISDVMGDLGTIHMTASRFELNYRRYPDSLAEIGLDDLRDPWGNPYQYLVVFARQDVGPVRKDHNMKPVNTGIDVYSMGPDGATASPFTSIGGKDDIVMANDGDYFGPACQYQGWTQPGNP
jgi:general secretion pathway protein G